MALYVYIKQNSSAKRKAFYYLSYLFLSFGLLMLFWSFYPIISFEIYSKLFLQKNIISPLSQSNVLPVFSNFSSVLGSSDLSSNLKDFTQANQWFPSTDSAQSKAPPDNETKEYKLSIPKLNINNAKVIVGGNDLGKSLIHYLPKSMPGEYGNVVIFGHSSLPQLYNVNNYKTIFTYLPSLENGDIISIKINEISYEYEVKEMFVVEPDQISVLEQKTDAVYLTLITCVPPGTYWKRLVVRAKLSQLPID